MYVIGKTKRNNSCLLKLDTFESFTQRCRGTVKQLKRKLESSRPKLKNAYLKHRQANNSQTNLPKINFATAVMNNPNLTKTNSSLTTLQINKGASGNYLRVHRKSH